MSIFDQIKAAVLRALGRFAARKAENQADGMKREAQSFLSGAQDLARRNPLGFGALALLGAGVLWLSMRRK